MSHEDAFNARFPTLLKAASELAKSNIIPASFRGKPADCFVALEYGAELGLPPMSALQNIYVVNGRPTLSAQGMAGLVKRRADYNGMQLNSSPQKAVCVVKRRLPSGAVEEHTGEFTFTQAQVAGLTGKDNWKGYPQQMLEARAIAFAMRKAYPDVLAGIYTKEEAEDFDTRPLDPADVSASTSGPAAPEPKAPEAPPAEDPELARREARKAKYENLAQRMKDAFASGAFMAHEIAAYRDRFDTFRAQDPEFEAFELLVQEVERKMESRTKMRDPSDPPDNEPEADQGLF
jgi:hypothetical protein